MGIEGLLKSFIQHTETALITLEALRNKVVGVDASIYLMKWLCTNEAVGAYFLVEPRLNIDALVYEFWDSLLKKLHSYGIIVILVIDGERNPAKAATNIERERQRNLALSRLLNLIESNDGNDPKEAYKYMKQCAYVREDIVLATVEWARDRKVRFLCSPMESDWQLVALERSGITDASLTEDSDLIAIGSKTLLSKVSFDNGTALMLKPTEEWRTWVLNVVESHATDWSHDDFISYCVFVGCDYVKRPKNMGERTIIQFMKYWIFASWRKKISIIKYIEKKGNFPSVLEQASIDQIVNSISSAVPRYPNYFFNFWKAFFIFKYPPVFNVVIGNNNNWEDVRLVLLRAELINHDADVIKATIGNTNNLYLGLESVEIELQSIYANMHDNVWIRTKTAITTSGIKSTGTIPWHAHVNFIKIPPMLMPKQVLTNYLKTRGIQVNTTTDFEFACAQ
jgi:exonuclease-1